MAKDNNVSWFRIITLVFIFLAGIALARAEIALNGSNRNSRDIVRLTTNYEHIEKTLDRLEDKLDKVLQIER